MPHTHTARFELKQLFHLMLPILITQFAQAGLGLIDTIMAGHLSAADLAAIAIGVGPVDSTLCCFAGIMIATTPLVAEARAQKPQRKSHHCTSVPWVAAILGMVAMLILQCMPFFLPCLVPESLPPKPACFACDWFGMPAVMMYAALRSYSEALGHPRPVTAISLIALLVLIPLNFFLCTVLDLSLL